MPAVSAQQLRRATGRRGEQLAAEHLRRLGFTILARNVRSAAGEIDLIASDGQMVAFVEVKTTRRRAFRPVRGPAATARSPAATARSPAALAAAAVLERLGARQRRRLRGLALDWLRAQPRGARSGELRFDAIGVVIDGDGALLALEHLEGAW
jgi:putative endonuclease